MKKPIKSFALISSVLTCGAHASADPKNEKAVNVPKSESKVEILNDSEFELFIKSVVVRVISHLELEDGQPSCGGASAAK